MNYSWTIEVGPDQRELYTRAASFRTQSGTQGAGHCRINKSITVPVTATLEMDMEFCKSLVSVSVQPRCKYLVRGQAGENPASHFSRQLAGGAGFILATRCLYLDCMPMSGFDKRKLDAEFSLAKK